MGRKANPIILRIDKTYASKAKYIEKKSLESPIYNFKNIEIENFIKQFFNSYGLSVHDLKLSFFNSTLYIFVSYFSTLKANSIIKNVIHEDRKIKFLPKKVKYSTDYVKLINHTRKRNFYRKALEKYQENNSELQPNGTILPSSKIAKNRLLGLKRIPSATRARFLKYFANYNVSKKYDNISSFNSNTFLTKFFESLSLFTKQKINFSLVIKPINAEIKQEITKKNIKALKKNLVRLRKYEKNKFFKEGIDIMFLSVIQKNSAELLAKFIAQELQKQKRHNFFIRFLKNTLTQFHTKAFSYIKGIKIQIKGRVNGAPRARHKILEIKNGVPAMTINSKIDYFEAASFTANGTLGVKVWICEK
jgi:hypothetical protein|uniref:Ribosomal protein S3 n=1 Tax=Fistulifera solaris TaxID=1519565 RepID=A0A0U2HKZ9_FISSO|nr:ribosomal protein S3 [Fistulifera solaris]ALG35767.1 ribosomal protein S3 [Fistulifera solaris]